VIKIDRGRIFSEEETEPTEMYRTSLIAAFLCLLISGNRITDFRIRI